MFFGFFHKFKFLLSLLQLNSIILVMYIVGNSLKTYPRSHGAIAEVFGVAELYYAVDVEFFAC